MSSGWKIKETAGSPDRFQELLASLGLFCCVLLPTAYKQVSALGLTTLNLHELVELQNAPLATCVPFAALVEDGCTGMMHADFSLPV